MIIATSPTLGHNKRPQVTREAIPPAKKHYDKDAVKAAAHRQWADILPALTRHSAEYFDGRQHPCPMCGSGDDRFQMFDVDAGACRCRRCNEYHADGIASVMWLCGVSFTDAVDMIGDHLHLTPSPKSTKSIPKPKTKPPKPKPKSEISDEVAELRHEVYTAAAKIFGLSDDDRKLLHDRGLSDEDIERAGYWSLPRKTDRTVRLMKLANQFPGKKKEIAENVPGMFPGGSLQITAQGAAIMIPSRDIAGRVVGLRDHNPNRDPKYKWISSSHAKGPSPGSPCHCPTMTEGMHAETIRITEGEFKGDIATAKTGVFTIALAGTSTWQSAITVLEHHKPSKIMLAFDSDAETNGGVGKSLGGLWEHCTTASWNPNVAVETWENAKGIDDALQAGEKIKVLSFDQSADYIMKIRGPETLQDILDDLQEHEEPHDPARLARLNVSRYESVHGGHLAYWRGQWWKYRTGQWTRISDEEIDAKIRFSINQELTNIALAQLAVGDEKPSKIKSSNSMVRNVIGEMKSHCLLSSSAEMPSMRSPASTHDKYLSLENGLLDLGAVIAGGDPADAMSEHTPDWFCGTKLAIAFQPGSKCPRFDKYLLDALPDEESRLLIQEYAGYILEPGNDFQRFLALEGDGGTGKSVMLSGVLPALIGVKNLSSVKFEGFGKNQFALNDTIGKALNVDPDVNQDARTSEGLFKAFASGEPIQFEPKGKEPFSALPTAKVALGWNTRPHIRDKSMGVWRRMLLIGFDRKVPESEIVIGMDKAKWWIASGELPGILCWAIEGLQRLHSQGGFTISEAMRTRIAEYKTDMNPVAAFISEVVEHDPASKQKTTTDSIVAAFRHWCEANSDAETAAKMNARSMGRAITKHFGITSQRFDISLSSKREQARGFEGIFLNDTENENSNEKNSDS